MSRLNPRQQEAVNYVGGPLLVLAGAGSGKTSVITRKIAYLVQQCGIRAQYIVAVTFTNKAAREMKERVGTLLRGGEGKGLTVSTFHNLGLNIIRKEHERLGYKPGFSIFDESDIKALLTDIMQKEYSGDDGVDEIKNYIGAWKNDLILPEEALEKARNPKEQTAATAQELARRLRNMAAVAATPPQKGIRVLGPGAAPIARLRGEHRFHIQLQAPQAEELRAVVRRATAGFTPPDDVRWIVDVDPWDMQ